MSTTFQADSISCEVLRVNSAVYFPDGAVTNEKMDSTNPADQTKVKPRHKVGWSQKFTDNAVAERRVVYRAKFGGTLSEVAIGSAIAATGDSTATIQIRKNGTNFLTSTVVLDNGNTAFITEPGTPNSSGAYVAGDVFEVDVSAVSAGTGTLPKGLFADLCFDENTF